MKKLICILSFLTTVIIQENIVVEPFEPIKSMSEQVQQKRDQERLQEQQQRYYWQQNNLYNQEKPEVKVYINQLPTQGAFIK